MIRVLRALAWLRWRQILNGFRKSRRDTLERASRLAEFAVPAILGVLAIPTVLTLAAGALAGGFLASHSDTARTVLAIVPRAVLAVLTVAVLLGPLVRTMQGATLGLSRLLLLPISRRLLHLAEFGAGLADPWVLAVLPSLLALPAGLLLSGSVAAAAAVLAAGVAIAVVLAALGSATSFVVALLLRDRRRGEWVSVVVLAALSFAGFLPMLFSSPHHRRTAEERAAAAPRRGIEIRSDGELPAWTLAAPSEMYGLALRQSLEGRPAAALLPVGGMAAAGAALYALSFAAYRRLLDTPAGSASRRRGERRGPRLVRIPGLSAAVSAVAVTQTRYALRTVRGKTGVFFTPLFAGVLAFVGPRAAHADPTGTPMIIASGAFLPWTTALLAVLSLQPFLLNQFATDRAGLTLQFLAPLRDRDIVRGKAVAMGVLWALSMALSGLVGFIAAPGSGPAPWVSAGLGGASVLALLAPAAAVLSALFPKSSDPGRIGRAGNPHPTAGLVGSLLTLALCAPAAGLAGLGLLVMKSQALTIALLAGWAAVATVAGTALLGAAAAVVSRRRENLALVAQGR